MKHVLITYYKDILTEHSYGRQHDINVVLQHIPRLASNDQNTVLMRPISFQEVEIVVMNMPKNNALGLDGYTSYLFQTCWIFLGKEIQKLIEES